MLKMTGVILCIAGCAGYGFSRIISWKKELEEVYLWILLFQKVKSKILYQRKPLEEICIEMEQENLGICGKMAARVGVQSKQNRLVEFADIWREELEKMEKESFLVGKKRELLYKFPDFVDGQDCSLQENLFSFYMEEWVVEKQKLEELIQEKQKPVLAVSFIGGLIISILLV